MIQQKMNKVTEQFSKKTFQRLSKVLTSRAIFKIDKILTEWQPTQIIVGIPEDSEQNKPLRKKISLFCTQLSDRSKLPVSKHDETLTSDEAYLQLKNKRKAVKSKINKKDHPNKN